MSASTSPLPYTGNKRCITNTILAVMPKHSVYIEPCCGSAEIFCSKPKAEKEIINDYAYETGLTDGVSATQFGTGTASAQMYFTFVLRALGETDTEDYTVYDHAFELMGASGILSTENDPYEICTRSFWRADMVVVSYRALSAKTASGEMLWERLVEAGVFTADELNAAA